MKCLLLNSTYDGLNFITEIKSLKLYFNNKVEIISSWNEEINWVSGSMQIPAIIKLKYYVRFIPRRNAFNRLAVFKRDNFMCMYCGVNGTDKSLTIDHVLPKSRGGLTTWQNTVSCCNACNLRKNNQTPEESGIKLLNKPFVPEFKLKNFLHGMSQIHPDWHTYL